MQRRPVYLGWIFRADIAAKLVDAVKSEAAIVAADQTSREERDNMFKYGNPRSRWKGRTCKTPTVALRLTFAIGMALEKLPAIKVD